MQEKKVIQGAFVVSLLLHLVLAAATWRIPLSPAVDPAAAAQEDPEVDIVLWEEDVPQESEPEMPKTFTSVPERQASEVPPEDPDYLASHHSIAADNKLGDSDEPSADEEWIAEQVEIRKDTPAGSEGEQYAQQPLPETEQGVTSTEEGAAGPEADKAEGEDLSQLGEWIIPEQDTETGGETQGQGDDPQTEEKPDLEDWWGGEAPSVLKEGEQGERGDEGFDFDQAARGKVRSGVAFQENFSLNTWQWNYAPWMQWFINQLHRHWNPPYAYKIGAMDGGYTVLRIVVEKNGRVTSLEIVETEGHESFHSTSKAAVQAFQPYRPLPDNFPEPNLVITLGLHYPDYYR